MPQVSTFIVRLTQADTGEVRYSEVGAVTAEEAMRRASGDGWLASAARLKDSTDDFQRRDVGGSRIGDPELRALMLQSCNELSGIREHLDKLQRKEILRRPINTIGCGVVAGLIVFGILVVILWFVIGALMVTASRSH